MKSFTDHQPHVLFNLLSVWRRLASSPVEIYCRLFEQRRGVLSSNACDAEKTGRQLTLSLFGPEKS